MDENSPNTVVSYYAKGSLIALALDLMIRDFTQHQQSLDDVMRCLWKKHGDIHQIPPGLKEDGFKEIVLETIGVGFASLWNQFEKRYIYGTEDLPLQALFLSNHYCLEEQKLPLSEIVLKRLGIRTTNQESWVKVTHVMDDGGALLAGIAAGDLLVSINRERITPSNLNSLLERFAGQSFQLMVFRQDILHECAIKKDQRVFSKWQIQATTP
jgi:predicted metalloprotease with PDZ domain